MLDTFDLHSSRAHAKLTQLAQSDGQRHLVDLFRENPERFEQMHTSLPGLLFDWSKHRLTDEVMRTLIQLADEAGWKEGRHALFSGQRINQTENRAVLHMAMRGEASDSFSVDGESVMPGVLKVREQMLDFAEKIRSNKGITDVVNIGIGGSDLGPLMVTRALRSYSEGPAVHFVSNVDGAHLQATLSKLKPEHTLVIVVSKTFTTQETMANADEAKKWLVEGLGKQAVPDHFAAVSTNVPAAMNFGIDQQHVFGFSDWVGGRYSLWGPVGLSIACAVGAEHFKQLLAGAREMDQHFQEAPATENMPLISALIGLWYTEYLGFPTYAILPYAQDLDRFPAYMQQADMESNGKSMGRDGLRVKHQTGPVIWGEAGTNGQHAFYQLLHQGTTIHPADIIACKSPLSPLHDHHVKLMANAVAQAEALMIGKTLDEVKQEMRSNGIAEEDILRIAPHRVFDGNRPTGFILLECLNPRTLGMLISWYEHKIFLQGLFWNVCSFDQWGVELGKQLAGKILDEWSGGQLGAHDASTIALLKRMSPKI